jgi:glycosyltransferase involved in cell wall biosynthesis
MMDGAFVSILMLTHDAPRYVRAAVESVRARTEDVAYEIVVLDNASGPETVALVKDLKARGLIDRLVLSPLNTLFARGNNLAAQAADPRATHLLLLNSDVEARDPRWLRRLLDAHAAPGIAAYGVVADPPLRVDGYCLLIDAESWRARGGLDEGFQWWWGVTKLQAGMLADGLAVKGWYDHDRWLVHHGGQSGDAFRGAAGMGATRAEVEAWFGGRRPQALDPWRLRRARARRALGRMGRRAARALGVAGR